MKIAAVTDPNGKFVPLDLGNKISIIDTEEKKIFEYNNPGYNKPNGGKEIAMASILRLQPDAIITAPGSLCPGSYRMSMNRVKYIIPNGENIEEFISEMEGGEELTLLEEVPIEIYKEEY